MSVTIFGCLTHLITERLGDVGDVGGSWGGRSCSQRWQQKRCQASGWRGLTRFNVLASTMLRLWDDVRWYDGAQRLELVSDTLRCYQHAVGVYSSDRLHSLHFNATCHSFDLKL
jgi:hypothetical protein